MSAPALHGKSNPPYSNANFWNVYDCVFAPCGGGAINVRGDETNGGNMYGNMTVGTTPLTQADHVEAHFS